MGCLAIKEKLLRCEKCFMLRLFLIKPDYPQSTLIYKCSCGFFSSPILSFTKALQSQELYKIKCSICNKEAKHPLYCPGCHQTFCPNCKSSHNTEIKTRTKHILIDSYKYDFYCAEHQDVFNNAYCDNCKINICQNCIKENLHKGHIVYMYNQLILNKNDEKKIKTDIEASAAKIIQKINMSKVLIKQLTDKNQIENLKEVVNTTMIDNKSIIALIQYFYHMYIESKHKNYAIIYNLKENIKFNLFPFQLYQSTTLDERLNDFIEYLKSDFVLFKRLISTRKNQNIIVSSKKQEVKKDNEKSKLKAEIQEKLNNMQNKKGINENDNNLINNDDINENDNNLSNNEEINESDNNINDENISEEKNDSNIEESKELINEEISEIKEVEINNDNNKISEINIINNNIDIRNNGVDGGNKKKRISIFDINEIINEKYDDAIFQEDSEDIDFDIKPQTFKMVKHSDKMLNKIEESAEDIINDENKEGINTNNSKEENPQIFSFKDHLQNSESDFEATFNPAAVKEISLNDNSNELKDISNIEKKEEENNIIIEQDEEKEQDQEQNNINPPIEEKILDKENKNEISRDNQNNIIINENSEINNQGNINHNEKDNNEINNISNEKINIDTKITSDKNEKEEIKNPEQNKPEEKNQVQKFPRKISGLKARLEMFERKSSNNIKEPVKPPLTKIKTVNILNNPKYTYVAKNLNEKMPHSQNAQKEKKVEKPNILSKKIDPNTLMMNRPTVNQKANKKKPKKISFF